VFFKARSLHVAEQRTADDAWAAARAVVNSDVDSIDQPAGLSLVAPELVRYLQTRGFPACKPEELLAY